MDAWPSQTVAVLGRNGDCKYRLSGF